LIESGGEPEPRPTVVEEASGASISKKKFSSVQEEPQALTVAKQMVGGKRYTCSEDKPIYVYLDTGYDTGLKACNDGTQSDR
jgi:hypothetical protein